MSVNDRARAAAIGNTTALIEVLKRQVADVARDRDDQQDAWATSLSSEGYAKILATFVMELLKNEQQHATTSGFKIHENNDAALSRAVTRVRQGGSD